MVSRVLFRDVSLICLAILAALEVGTPAAADGEIPHGNTGVIAVDDVAITDVMQDVPHPGCRFVIDLSGYGAGSRTATIQVVGREPTGGGELFVDSLAFEGSSREAIDLSAEVSRIEPDPVRGQHVQLNIHVDGSQGADLKHKGFWVSGCAA